jgi:outer membrane protein
VFGSQASILLIASLLALTLSAAWAQGSPLTFQATLQRALSSPSVSIAQSQLDLAQEQLQVASSPLSAQFSTGYTKTWRSLTADNLPQPRSLNSSDVAPLKLSASLNVIPYGPSHDQLVQAQWGVVKARAALRDAKATALLAVAQQYLSALRAAQTVTIKQQALSYAHAALTAVKLQVQLGGASDAQLLAAQLAVTQAENDLAAAKRAQAAALASLSLTLGVSVSAVAGEPPESHDPAIPADLTSVLAERSDVLGAELAVLNARQNADSVLFKNLTSGSLSVSYKTGDRQHSFGLGASFDTRSFEPGVSLSYDPDSGVFSNLDTSLQHPSGQSFSVSLGLKIPLNTALPAALEAARLSVKAAQQQLAQARASAKLSLESAQQQLAAAREALTLSRQILKQSQQALATARKRLKLGLISKLEVNGAQQDAAQARLSYAQAKDKLLLARMQLAQALAHSPLEVF